MRHRTLHVLLSLIAACVLPSAEGAENYGTVTGRMAERAIEAALLKQPARWKRVSITFRYNITDDGRVRDVRVTSHDRNVWVESAARRTLLSLRMPPVPKQLVAQVGHNRLYGQGRFILEPK
jgi:hypothetical protein